MAVRSQPFKLISAPVVITHKSAAHITKHRPRRCMVVSTGLVLAGFSIPFLMVMELLPVTLLLGLIGLGLAATGGLMLLVLCGEL